MRLAEGLNGGFRPGRAPRSKVEEAQPTSPNGACLKSGTRRIGNGTER